MERDETGIAERLEAAAAQLERALGMLEEHRGNLSGEIARISATVENVAATSRENELAEKLAIAQREIAELKAGMQQPASATPLSRKTVPTATAEMLAKRGIGDGPIDTNALDAALSGLSLEQRIAVKTQLLRAGAIA